MLIFDFSHIRPGAALIIGKPVRRKRKPVASATPASETPAPAPSPARTRQRANKPPGRL